MRNLTAFLVGLALALIVGVASASAPSCPHQPYEYRATAGGDWGASVVGAVMPHAQYCATEWNANRNACGLTGSTTRTWTVTGCTEVHPTSVCTYNGAHATMAAISRTREFATQQRATESCPPDACDAYLGKKVTYAQNFPGGLPEMGGNYNIPVAGGCGAQRSAASSCTAGAGGAFFCMVTYTYTGDPPESAPSTPGGGQATCAMVQGKQNCAVATNEDTGQTCGTFNGERVCFPADPTVEDSGGQPSSGACWSTSGGGMLCADDAVVEDAAGDPVSPTQVLVTGSGTSYYYDSTTVSTSSVTTIITGSGPMGSETPGAESDCEGADCLEGGEMGSVGDADDVASGAMGRIGGAPIVAAVSGLSGSLTGGACPSWASTIDAGAFGTYELDFSFICSMWEDIAPVIAAVMLAGWVLVALRILMSA